MANVCRIGKEGENESLVVELLDRSLSNSSNNRRILLAVMIMKFWRVNFKNPSTSFKKRRLLRRVDGVRWYQVICTRVDHGFTTMNILNLFEWIQFWWYFQFVILSMNFIAKKFSEERSRSYIIIIFSRIYFKSLRNENIPPSISLSVKIYWYKYLNFNFLRFTFKVYFTRILRG